MNDSNIVLQNLQGFLKDWEKEDRFFFVLMIQNFSHFQNNEWNEEEFRLEIFNFTMNILRF